MIPLFLGCSASGPNTGVAGGNPLTPPGPPAEVPTALRIPKDFGLNLEKVQGAEASASAALTLKYAVPPDGEFSDDVIGSTDFVQFFIDALKGLMDPYNQLVIPVGTNIHTFQGVSVVQGSGEANFVQIKVDFAPFDFDDDGVKEACSGHTAALPICMRIYADGVKQFAAVFTDFPTETNPGAGRLMGLNITNSVFLFPKDSFLGINYDLHDPSSGKSVEYLVRENPEHPSGEELEFHLSFDQVGEESVSLKTINFNLAGEIGAQQGVFRWKEDDEFWSGRIHTTAPDESGLTDLDNQCVNLNSGDGLERSQCIGAGVDVGEIPFVSLPDETTLFLPEDFPESPPF